MMMLNLLFYSLYRTTQVSDEDRDDTTEDILNYASTLLLLQLGGWQMHAILNNPIIGVTDGIGAIENSDNLWTVYSEDTDPNSPSLYIETQVNFDPVGSGPGKPDYSPLAFATDGAVWDLNKLRDGGFTAKSFAEAFVETTTTESK